MKAKFPSSIRLLITATLSLVLIAGTGFAFTTVNASVLPSISTGISSAFTAWWNPPAKIELGASVSTDMGEYAPGQIVQISGAGWQPNETVQLEVDHVGLTGLRTESGPPHEGHDPWQVQADGAGNISSSWLVDEDAYGQTLILTAVGLSSGSQASTTFLDSIGYNKGVYNKDTTDPESDGNWTTGNAGDAYLEDQWVYYQYQVEGITTTTPSFDVTFNHFQSNTQAIFIDAFTNFRACVDCTEDTHTSGPDQGMLLDDIPHPSASTANWKVVPATIGAPTVNVPINAVNGTLNASGQCVATEDPVNTPSEEHCFHVDGAKLQALFPAGTFSSGTHTITLFYEAHLSSTFTWRAGTGGLGHEYLMACPSDPNYIAAPPEAVPATVFGTEAYWGGDPCALDTGDWSAPFKGVGSATGSSRHFNLTNQSAGSSGAITLPIPTVEAPTGSVTIVKVTNPASAVGTVFNFTGDLGGFNLDTDPSVTNPNSRTFTELPGGVTFSVNESPIPASWTLTNIVCTGGGTFSYDADSANITLDTTSGASVTCTFTNTNFDATHGRIVVVKDTVPNDSTLFTFNTTGFPAPPLVLSPPSGSNFPSSFQLSDGQFRDSCSTTTLGANDNCLTPSAGGLYFVTETANSDYVTTANCVSDQGAADSNPATGIPVAAGETVTCTFVNTKKASVTLVKNTIGGNATFTFDTSGTLNGQGTPAVPDPVSITTSGGTGSSATFVFSVPAAGSSLGFTENALAGWNLTGTPSCTGGDADNTNPASMNVEPGENIVCTWTNTKQASVQLVKNTIGGNGTFTYDTSGTLNGAGTPSVPDPVSITTSGGTGSSATWVFSNLPAAGSSLNFVENALAGWDLTGTPSCTGGDADNTNPGSMNVEPGEVIVCTFTNTKQASVQLVKNTIGGNATFTYDTSGTLNGQGTPAVPDPVSITTAAGTGSSATWVFSNLPAAGSSLAFVENALAGWSLTGTPSCTGGDADNTDPASLNVEPGEVIVCTFTNTKQASVQLVKNTIGGNATFTYDTSGALNGQGTPAVPDPVSITTAAGTGSSATWVFSNLPAAGSSLNFVENALAGWDLTGTPSCTGGDADNTNPGSMNVEPGETIVCTFTNTKRASVQLVKNTIGGNATFTYDTSGTLNGQGTPAVPDPVSITTAAGTGSSATWVFANLPAAGSSLSFVENALAGWNLTGTPSCSGGDADNTDPGAMNVEPGETIVCTFTNTKQASVQLVKNTLGGNATFTFDTSGTLNGAGSPTVPDPVSITTAGGTGSSSVFVFSNLPAAGSSLGFVENALAGWSLVGSPSCTGGDADNTNPASMNVEPGEVIVCTWTNANPDAQIDLTPLTATNEVNDDHIITAIVQQDDKIAAGAPGDGVTGFGPAPDGTLVTFSLLNNTANAAFVGGNTCLTSGGTGTCTVTINTTTPGGVDIHATTTFTVASVSLTRATGTGGLNSADAHKTYVDAQIDVTPLDDTNPVGQDHVITATVQQDDGIAAPAGDNVTGFGPAPNGTTVTFSFVTNTAGAVFVGGDNDCTTTAGSCSVTINATSPGLVIVKASTSFSVGGVLLTRETGTGGLNSAHARKVYVDAQIDVTPLTDTNPVGQVHVITATVQQDDGLAAGAPGDSVTGFGAAPNGTTVTFSFVTNTAGATFVGGDNDCTTTAGSCTVSINAPNAGLVIVQATTTFNVGGLSLTRTTGTGGLNSGHAQKVYVDAQIDISPLVDTNPVNEAHTFTATVQQDDGIAAPGGDNVNGFGPAPNGTQVSFSFVTNTIGAFFVGGVNTCTINNGLGTCTVQINSASPGSVTVSATTTFSVGGQSLTRTTGTGGLNSDNAVKNYVASRLRIRKLVVPDEGTQAFTFSPTGGWNGGSNFDLQRNQTKDSGLIPPGTYGADETLNPAYVLTNVACVQTGTAIAKTFTPTSPSGKSGVSVVLAASEDVTCTFTNSKLPTLTVVKVITGNPTTFDFAIDRDPSDPVIPPDLQLSPTGDGPAGADSDGPNVITVGAHNVKEVNIPSDWLLTDFSCESDQGGFGIPVKSGSNISFSAGYGDDVTCTFINNQQGGTTRTQGFWATHTVLTNLVWNGGTLPAPNQNVVFTPVINSPDAYLCNPPVGTPPVGGIKITAIVGVGTNQVMGGFWSSISMKSDLGKTKGGKRTPIDKVRMQFLQQYLAAVLNVHLFGTSLPAGSSLAGARAAYCGNNQNAISTYAGILAGYNEAGDNGLFTPGANATAQESKKQADILFWDNPGIR